MNRDPDEYDCQTCPVMAWQRDLDPANLQAWRVYQQVRGRFVAEAGIGATVFDLVVAHEGLAGDREAILLLIRRLSVLHDVLAPKPTAPAGGERL